MTPPASPLGITGITLGSRIHLQEQDQQVRIGIDMNTHVVMSPAMARQVAAWLLYFADASDTLQANMKGQP